MSSSPLRQTRPTPHTAAAACTRDVLEKPSTAPPCMSWPTTTPPPMGWAGAPGNGPITGLPAMAWAGGKPAWSSSTRYESPAMSKVATRVPASP
ncbi:hypothetical protein ACN28I_46070 [Archangium gephyra]|uniref:hypothetical protein n=1 Tax=Archangium gephyra TaxID=48 RepID=UPI003B7E5B0F